MDCLFLKHNDYNNHNYDYDYDHDDDIDEVSQVVPDNRRSSSQVDDLGAFRCGFELAIHTFNTVVLVSYLSWSYICHGQHGYHGQDPHFCHDHLHLGHCD